MRHFTSFLLTLTLSLIGHHAAAQGTINNTRVPAIGDTIQYANMDTTVSEGAGGISQTWDFSTDSILPGTAITYLYVDPTTEPDGPTFPNATVAETDPTTIQEYTNFYEVAANEMRYWGAGYPTSSATSDKIYSNAEVVMDFPFQNGSSNFDIWAMHYTGAMGHKVQGTTNIIGDGTGTLITPFDTFPTTVRVFRTRNYTDSTTNPNVILQTVIERSYEWYNTTSSRNPVMTITYFEYTDPLGNKTYDKEARIQTDGTFHVGVDRPQSTQFKITPNPASGYVKLQGVNAAGTWNIFDITGKNVLTGEFSPYLSPLIDVSTLPPGIYLLNMRTVNGYMETHKLVCE